MQRVEAGETVELTRHDRPVAEIRPLAGVGRAELLRRLAGVKFTKAEAKELKGAVDAINERFGHAGGN